jgi:hypothetical protein
MESADTYLTARVEDKKNKDLLDEALKDTLDNHSPAKAVPMTKNEDIIVVEDHKDVEGSSSLSDPPSSLLSPPFKLDLRPLRMLKSEAEERTVDMDVEMKTIESDVSDDNKIHVASHANTRNGSVGAKQHEDVEGVESEKTSNSKQRMLAPAPGRQHRTAASSSLREPSAEPPPRPSIDTAAPPPITPKSAATKTKTTSKPKPHSKLPTRRTRSSGKPKNPSSNKKNDKDFRPDDSSEDDEPALKKRKGKNKTATTPKSSPVKKARRTSASPKVVIKKQAKRATATPKGKLTDNSAFEQTPNSEPRDHEMQDVVVHEDVKRDMLVEANPPRKKQEEGEKENQDGGQENCPPSLHPRNVVMSQEEVVPVVEDTLTRTSSLTLAKGTTRRNGKTAAVALGASAPQQPVLTPTDLVPRYDRRTTRSETKNQKPPAPNEGKSVVTKRNVKTTTLKPNAKTTTPKPEGQATTKRYAKDQKHDTRAGKKGEEDKKPLHKRPLRRVSVQEGDDQNIGKRLRSGDKGRKST